ncbi:HNH endonuclease [Clostridium sp. BNL1100]|uniref:HNH endonuclease n=1 Tax=Clostridium sp. BNL1100 TaxID=755731 RepID=UPI001FA815B7|nr:HNH endonuclease [Clostridium sp. BNL1100]
MVWQRDLYKCVHCCVAVSFNDCNIDHIISGKLGTNRLDNLRTLCKRCHILRLDYRHRGMIAKGLKDGIIPPNWRELVWDG